MNRGTALRSLTAVLTGLLVGCASSTGADDLRPPTPAQTSPEDTSTAPPAPPECDPVASYAPTTTPGASVQAIRDRGALVVAVSADTYLMGARNPVTGQIEGFDIDMANYVAEAVFGEPGHLQLRVITSAQRVPALTDHEVDLVARAFTMNCARWEQIAFSAEYYHAGQKVLVATDSSATGLDTLPKDTRVCAPAGTTTIAQLERDYPDVEPVPADTHTGCLALFQQGKVDAITGDDTILAGLAAQDPYAKVVGQAVSDEPYGLGVAADQADLAAYVNGVLEQVKADGRWAASYDRWLSVLGPAPAPPQAVYGR
ncbi:MAG: glutamate ABC transporter substrate-binding protein [Micrococcales bacterium]|nr:glutamate ABC transporter substrate-binding protein [Micrococcales bacterium]